MRIDQLETPALLIDLDIMQRNLQRAADYTQRHGLRLRPHIKTHKTPSLARRQLDLGAAGITVAKVTEAEAMFSAQPEDVLIAYPVLGERKLMRLMQLAEQAEITVALDSEEAVKQLGEAADLHERPVQVLVEVDAGLGRMGVADPADAVRLARCIARYRSLEFAGITFYPGHIKMLDEHTGDAVRAVSEHVDRFYNELRKAQMCPRIVSGGSTPLLYHSHLVSRINEIRPGTYIFNDRNTVLCGACTWDDCAATMLTTVVSTAKSGQVIIDGGSKTFSSDRSVVSEAKGFGVVHGRPDAHFFKMNEEHGFVEIPDHSYRVGDRVRVVPNHICVAVNLHEYIYGVRGQEVVEVWRVDARGKLQ